MRPWTRTLSLTLLLLTAVSAGPKAARAQVTARQLLDLQGRVVVLERWDGRWLLARILKVYPGAVVVQLEDATRGTVPLAALARVHRSPPVVASPPSRCERSEQPPAKCPPCGGKKSKKQPHRFRVEWIGLRGGVGLALGFPFSTSSDAGFAFLGELTLFTLHWRHFYWELLRAGGGLPFVGHWGTALGYPIHLDSRERHELRIGVHVSFWYGYLPSLSGLQLYYTHRLRKRFAVQVGLLQTSFPFSVTFFVGISM